MKGEAIATIYSAEMLTAQRTYVEHLGAGKAFPASEIAGVREKLLVLGLTAEDIADLEKERQPSATVVVRAPSDGTVIDRFAYEGQYVASFIGFLPASDPQLVVATMLDRPATEYGSIAAAPLFREIAAYGIARLGITPSDPLSLPPHALPLP